LHAAEVLTDSYRGGFVSDSFEATVTDSAITDASGGENWHDDYAMD
jgi:hypothetical protein